MKLSILGFSQQSLCKIDISAEDLIFLDWFIYFYASGKMEMVTKKGKHYGWINREYVLEQLPFLKISNPDSVTRFFTRLVKRGLVERITQQNPGQNGRRSFFKPTELVYDLMTDHQTQKPGDMQKHQAQVSGDMAKAPGPRVGSYTPTFKNTTTIRDKEENFTGIENHYQQAFKELYPSGTPIFEYSRTRKRIKEILKTIPEGKVISAIDKAKSDQWIVDNGFSLNTILSAHTLNRLINVKAKKNEPDSKGSVVFYEDELPLLELIRRKKAE